MVSDDLLAVGRDDDVVVIDGAREYSYADLRSAARRHVAALLEAGAAPGQRIGLLGTNSFFWVAGYLAAMKVGVVPPLSDKLTHDDLRAQLDWVDCHLVLADRTLQRRFAGALKGRAVLTDATLGTTGPEVWPEVVIHPNRDVALMFTSGTSSYQLLLKASSFASRPLPSLKHLQQAGGRLAPDLIRALAAQPDAEVFVMYGQTEATARLSFLPPGLLGSQIGSIGRGIPGVNSPFATQRVISSNPAGRARCGPGAPTSRPGTGTIPRRRRPSSSTGGC